MEAVLTALLASTILSSVPLMLAAVGESLGEQSGVLNLGVEGTMAFSGFLGFWTALRFENATIGLLSGALAGATIGGAFGLLSAAGRANQVVLGLGVTLAGTGASGFLFREAFGSDQPLLGNGLGRPLAGLGDWVPVVGPAVANQRWFVFAAWIGVAIVAVWFRRSRTGLRIRAAGESPLALDAVGGSVTLTRIQASSLAGLLTGLGGSSLVIVELGFFTPGVTAGSGFLAIALAMLGGLSPARVALLALAFGALTGLDSGLQVARVDAPTELLRMIPYLGILLALVVVGRGHRLPSALGQPYPAGDGR
jgi:simple sugar transport system permease protein